MNRAYLAANKVLPGSSKNCFFDMSAVPRSSTANFPNEYLGKGFRLLIFNVSSSSLNAVELFFEVARATSLSSLTAAILNTFSL